MSEVTKQEKLEKDAEKMELFLNQLGWERHQTGEWKKLLVDDSQGFPHESYECPFCNKVMDYPSIYCPQCGAKLGEE